VSCFRCAAESASASAIANLEELRQRDAAVRDQFVERAPLDQFHRHEAEAISLLGREDRDDVRVVEGGNGARLAVEAFTRATRRGACRR
jgi:phage replication-related protein YjqB (UPF0714/DUF867 family)